MPPPMRHPAPHRVARDGRRRRELFLIDGNSLAYRAFFALPESIATATGGRPTRSTGSPRCWSRSSTEHGPRRRRRLGRRGCRGARRLRPYKAQRKPRPDLLREQWPHLVPLVEAFGYTNVKVEGYEADDVIASLARAGRRQGIPVMVVTGDRDAYQLVGDGVRVMTTSRGITETKIYDREARDRALRRAARAGHRPDGAARATPPTTSPACPGSARRPPRSCCRSSARSRSVLANVDEISGAKRKQNLVEHADDARMSKQLATLQYDIETGVDLAEAMARRARPRRPARVHARVRAAGGAGAARGGAARGRGACPGRSVETELEVEAVEGTPADLRARAPAGAGDRRRALGGRRRRADRRRRARRLRRARGRRSAGARWSPTTPSRSAAVATGCSRPPPARGSSWTLAHDTMVAAYLLEPQRRTYELTSWPPTPGSASPRRPPRRRREDDGQLSLGEEGEAGLDPAEEARLVAALAEAQRPRIEELGLEPLLREVELPLVAGAGGDGARGPEARRRAPGRGRRRLRRADRELEQRDLRAGRARSSRSARRSRSARVLFEKLGLTRKRRGKTGFSTDARVLAQIRDEHPIVEKIESWRELTKLKSTYLDSLPDLIDPETGRIHTTFNQAATATGRLSSTNPNLQNIPIRTEIGRPVRACFVAERGARLLSADYSQVELRVLAHVADEEVLKEIFRRRRGRPRGDRGRGLRHLPRGGRRRPALEGEDGQLRHRLRADRLRPRRPAQHPPQGGRGVRRPLPGALPGRARLPRADDRARPGGGLRDDADGPPPRRSPSCARPTPTPAAWASAWPSTR